MSDQVPNTNGQPMRVHKTDVLLTFDPDFVLRFGLPDPNYPRSDQVPTTIGQPLRVSKIDVPLTLMQTHKQTHRQTIFFHMTLPTVEGINAVFSYFHYLI